MFGLRFLEVPFIIRFAQPINADQINYTIDGELFSLRQGQENKHSFNKANGYPIFRDSSDGWRNIGSDPCYEFYKYMNKVLIDKCGKSNNYIAMEHQEKVRQENEKKLQEEYKKQQEEKK